jgi:hypothetical protein
MAIRDSALKIASEFKSAFLVSAAEKKPRSNSGSFVGRIVGVKRKDNAVVDRKKLLLIKEVVEEINRHKWIQSEMVGYDIGFDKAADDWFKKYAAVWVEHHMPKNEKSTEKAATKTTKKSAKK